MGGKKQSSQRTKNNTRPSSSARSAEYLTKNSINFASNFNDYKQQLAILDPEASEDVLGIELVLALKKVNKKDPITKTKGLQEIKENIENSDLDRVKAFLPFWTPVYESLAKYRIDTDHKVREINQLAHSVIVKKCGRGIAPFLKRLLPSWLMAQFDCFAPAATCAVNSFQEVFPGNKLADVLIFCKVEVLTHICENLISEGPTKEKNESPEEVDVMHRRVISSLQLFDFFVKRLPAIESDYLWCEQSNILEAPVFWKYASNKNTRIRSAWFSLVAKQIERFPKAFGELYGAKVLKIIIGNLNEKDTIVSMQLWDCFLLLIDNVENWYIWVTNKEDFRKKIIDLVYHAGYGNIDHLSPLLLPLMAKLPSDMVDKEFCTEYISGMIYAIKNKSILSSKKHRQSWLSTLGDCIKYISTKYIKTFALETITNVHREWLKSVFRLDSDKQIKTNIIKHSSFVMSLLVKNWLKKSIELDERIIYDQLVRNFWQNIKSTIFLQIKQIPINNPECIEHTITNHIDLILTLKIAKSDKKNLTISFEDNTQETHVEVSKNIDFDLQRFNHNLYELANEVCSQYVQFSFKAELSGPVLSVLFPLMKEFNSRDLFVSIARDFDGVYDGDLYGFYDGVLKKWLLSDTMRCGTLIDIVFTLILHLSEEEQAAVLNSFKQLVPSLAEQCLLRALSHEYWSTNSFRTWLKSEPVAEILQRLCKRLCEHRDDNAKNLLVVSFTMDNDGELLIGTETGQLVLSTLCKQLDNADTFESIARIVAQLTTPRLATKATLLKLFTINCITEPDENITEETWCEVRSCWQDNVTSLTQQERNAFYEEAVVLLHEKLFDGEPVNSETIDKLIQLATSLLPNFSEHSSKINVASIIEISTKVLDFTNEQMNLTEHALTYDLVKGLLCCPYHENSKIVTNLIENSNISKMEFDKSDVEMYIKQCLFRSKFIEAITIKNCGEDLLEEDVYWSEKILAEEFVESVFQQMLHDFVVLRSLEKAFRFWQHHSIILTNMTILEKNIKDTLAILMPDTCGRYFKNLSTISMKEGYYWSMAWGLFCQLTERNCDQFLQFDFDHMESGVGYFHNLQASLLANQSNDKLRYETNKNLALRCFYLAHCVDNSQTKVDLTEIELKRCFEEQHGLVELLVTKYYEKNAIMLYDINLQPIDWKFVISNSQALDLLASAVSFDGWNLKHEYWDFINISLASIMQTLLKSKNLWNTTKFAVLCVSTFRLLKVVQPFIASTPSRCTREQPSAYIANLPQEWKDIFAPEINISFYKILMHVLAASKQVQLTPTAAIVLNELEALVRDMNWNAVPKELRDLKMIHLCLQVMETTSNHVIKYCAYAALDSIAKPVVLDDVDAITKWSEAVDDEDGLKKKPKLTLDRYKNTLNTQYDLLFGAIKHVKLMEESAVMVPFTDSYNVCLGFLLTWDSLLRTTELAHSDLELQYIEWFNATRYKEKLLSLVVRVLPEGVIIPSQDNGPASANIPAELVNHFHEPFTGTGEDICKSSTIGTLSCGVFRRGVANGADGARGWWSALDTRASAAVARLTAAVITPKLVQNEMKQVQNRLGDLKDGQVNIHCSHGTVVCELQVEECKLELTVEMTKEHPLVPPNVFSKPTLVHTHFIKMYLAYQNGSLWRAIEMWTEAVAKKVENSAICYICYCHMEPNTGQLPKTNCRTCKKKYHSKCLFKWFMSSSKNSCPLCRSQF